MQTCCTVVKMNSFVHFLEEFTAWQFASEINWPLADGSGINIEHGKKQKNGQKQFEHDQK